MSLRSREVVTIGDQAAAAAGGAGEGSEKYREKGRLMTFSLITFLSGPRPRSQKMSQSSLALYAFGPINKAQHAHKDICLALAHNKRLNRHYASSSLNYL